MLSSDLFSYLDSDSLSSSAGDPEEIETEDLLHNNRLNLFEDICYGGEVGNPASLSREILETGNCVTVDQKNTKQIIQINMSSDQEDELVKYLSGENVGSAPCIQVVRNPNIPHPAPANRPNRQCKNSGRDSNNSSPIPDEGLCMSRNAVAARENRKKKREYVDTLEKSVDQLKTDNAMLRKENETKNSVIKHLRDEVLYLKRVLENQTELGALLKNIQNTSGVKFHGCKISKSSGEPRGEKPTATVTGTVQRRRLAKRKMIELSDDEGDDIIIIDDNKVKSPALLTESKQSWLDHGYAAQPNQCANPGPKMKRKNLSVDKCSSDREALCNGITSGVDSPSVTDAGVCLHVCKGSVSLEFCANCSEKSFRARRVDDEDSSTEEELEIL